MNYVEMRDLRVRALHGHAITQEQALEILESALECCEKVHADDLESVFFSAHCVDCENEMCEGPSVPA